MTLSVHARVTTTSVLLMAMCLHGHRICDPAELAAPQGRQVQQRMCQPFPEPCY
jgi:hypothetical protein